MIIEISGRQWNITVVSDTDSVLRGLSGIQSIQPHTGMLFVLPYEYPITITTQDMLFDIGIVFIGDSHRVTDVVDMLPIGSTYATPVPCRYFLEVNTNEIEESGIMPGQIVSIGYGQDYNMAPKNTAPYTVSAPSIPIPSMMSLTLLKTVIKVMTKTL